MKMSFTRFLPLIAVLAALLGIGGESFAQTRVAEVVAIKGAAFITSGGRTQSAALGSAVLQGDQIHAPTASGVKLRFTDGATMSLGENSLITVHTYTQQGNNRTAIFEMLNGIFRAVVSPLTGDSVFAVRTPTAVAAVRSTDWMLATRADLTEVFVGEGAVAVRNLNPAVRTEVVLTPGDGTDVRVDAAPIGPVKWGPPRIRSFTERTTVE